MTQYLVHEATMAALDLHEAARTTAAAEEAKVQAATDKALARAREQLGG